MESNTFTEPFSKPFTCAEGKWKANRRCFAAVLQLRQRRVGGQGLQIQLLMSFQGRLGLENPPNGPNASGLGAWALETLPERLEERLVTSMNAPKA